MKPIFTKEFFLSHHCPPIKMTARELSRLVEAVNWKIDQHEKEFIHDCVDLAETLRKRIKELEVKVEELLKK